MLKRNLWKILLSLAILAWAVSELVPITDIPFSAYARDHVTAKPTEFNKLLDEAKALAVAHQAPSEFIALKKIAKDRQIDLTQFFPSINLSDVKNVDRKNTLLLDELLKRSKSKLQAGLDLKGGVSVTLEVDEKAISADSDYARAQKLSKAVEVISNRVNQFGVSEPVIRPVGKNRIEVQVAGLDTRTNPDVVEAIKKPARLDFRLVHPQIAPSVQPMPVQEVPAGYEVLPLEDEDKRTGDLYTSYYVVKQIPEMTGEHIERAGAMQDQIAGIQVHMNFDKEGAKQFGDVTSANVGRLLAIVLDGKLYSAPRINGAITGGSAQITGRFDVREAERLASALNNPLALPLVVKEQNEVGPSLAEDAVKSGVKAAVIGTGLVAVFMIAFYGIGGVVSIISLVVNILIILGVMANLGATMTLPGLAGIVLTIGMAVDANILIFERIREELAAGKSLSAANQSGFTKALTTILDAHFVQLIICGIMIWLGTGPIKGFGVTLLIGVLSTLFSVLITGHLLMELLIDSGWVKKFSMRRMIKDLNVDFVRYGKPAAIGSVALVVISIAYVVYQGPKIYGIDFAGGDVVSFDFKDKLDTGKISEAAKSVGVSEANPTYVSPIGGGKEMLKVETPEGKGAIVAEALKKAFPTAGLEVVGQSQIGASIGKEIELNALKAIGVSMVVILIYIAFRFEFGFGVGAMASTLHDILMNIGIFVLFQNQFSAPMVAAILCVAGYSINETVVVFDRIREELKLNPGGQLRDVINSAIRKVFARTIMTASTTFLAALALFVFGGGVLHAISFTFLVGIVTSTFSAIFIAAQVFYWWHKGDRKHVEAHSDVAPKYEWQGSSKASE
jgi:SecD/SecF fusion protein